MIDMTFLSYQRRPTRAVFIGQIGVGGRFPIRVQSMLTSDTKNTQACLKEIQELAEAGCEIIRLTVPTKADLENLPNIRREMQKLGLKIPLVADIHFTPSIALDVVDHVEKVRINPGNFVDKKLFQKHEYSDAEYSAELKRIEDKFAPLVLKCKERGVAMRIGTNHGSLSDRILNRYGDTPQGMVESALEFLRIAENLGYYDIILSMKASQVQVMVLAYRLLAERLHQEKLQPYPFHLGVTEAGDGEDARIKSAIGIGCLLEEGLGDTIRVSLTEDSVREIPVAYAIANPYNAKFAESIITTQEKTWTPKTGKTIYERRLSRACRAGALEFGNTQPVRVWASFGAEGFDHSCFAQNSDPVFEGVEFTPQQIAIEAITELQRQKRSLGLISKHLDELQNKISFAKRSWIVDNKTDDKSLQNFIDFCENNGSHLEFVIDAELLPDILTTRLLPILQKTTFTNTSFSVLSKKPLFAYRKLAHDLLENKRQDPIHLRFAGDGQPIQSILSSIALGSLLIDGMGDSLQIMGESTNYANQLFLSYAILQASRVRMSKTEYIACPSCGRTLFDLQEVTAKIKARTQHLKGVKIGIMGCIVNGPGEMADADFGYVGTGAGKISLYVGQNCVERNIPQEFAVDRLVNLIKTQNRWIEPLA